MKRLIMYAVLLTCALSIIGCTDNGWEIVYEPPMSSDTGVVLAATPMKTITVYDLVDERQDKVNVGGEYNMLGTMPTRYVSTKPATQIITEAIITNLESQGLLVIRSSGWNGDPRAIPDLVTDLALGGKLKVFWVERQPSGVYLSYFGWSGANASSQVIASITIMAPDGTVLWQGDISGSDTYRTQLGIGEPKKMLEKALADAVNQLSDDPQIRRLWYQSVGQAEAGKLLVAFAKFVF